MRRKLAVGSDHEPKDLTVWEAIKLVALMTVVISAAAIIFGY